VGLPTRELNNQKLNGVEKVTFFCTPSLFETGGNEELRVLAG
jgi:hypothetical protein